MVVPYTCSSALYCMYRCFYFFISLSFHSYSNEKKCATDQFSPDKKHKLFLRLMQIYIKLCTYYVTKNDPPKKTPPKNQQQQNKQKQTQHAHSRTAHTQLAVSCVTMLLTRNVVTLVGGVCYCC